MRKKRSISQQLSVNNRFIAAVMFFVLSLVTALPLSAREIQKMEKKMKKKNEGTYNYFADGAKFSLTDANGLTRLYLGPFTLPEKYRVRLPNFTEDLSFSNGYISEDSPTTAVQPYKLLYNGKELQLMAQTPLIDYGARQYNPITTRWNAPDPMSEKYYAYSAYAYCVGDPNNRMDIDGLWDIKVSANSDRSKQPYAILTVTDRTGRIIYRTVVKVKGSYRDRTKTNADTPTGNYKILEWRRTGNNTNYNISSYGPNDLLALDYQKGEAEGKRNGIHVHGGEKGTDKQSLKGTYGCIRISNDDIKELKEL